jgi:hypothetical protein
MSLYDRDLVELNNILNTVYMFFVGLMALVTTCTDLWADLSADRKQFQVKIVMLFCSMIQWLLRYFRLFSHLDTRSTSCCPPSLLPVFASRLYHRLLSHWRIPHAQRRMSKELPMSRRTGNVFRHGFLKSDGLPDMHRFAVVLMLPEICMRIPSCGVV